MRLLLWVLLLPFRLAVVLFRRAYVLAWGYSVLRLHVHGHLPDRRGAGSLLGALSGQAPGPALLDLLIALDRAARDPRIVAVFVELGSIHTGLARAEELGAALRRVRDAGKRVVVYLEEAGLPGYLIALGGSELVMPPGGALNVTGIASEVVLLGGVLEHVGVRAWMRARGKYKTARETFSEREMTEANREMTTAIVGDLHAQLVSAVATGRGLSEDDVRARLDQGPFLAAEARALGLVDQVAYEDEILSTLELETAPFRPVRLHAYLRLSTHVVPRGRAAVVGLVEVSGHIKSGPSVPGRNGPRATGSKKLVEDVEKLAKDPGVRAIVLRVNSPGGSALASDVMWRALSKARQAKPVVVSMVDVAASGGYFVSGIKDTPILASRATITGSIGVLSGKFDATELYAKLGVNKQIVSMGRRAAFFSEAKGFTDDDLAKLEADLDAHYEHFLSRMAEGRGKTTEEIHAVAQGRVWTGQQALANGLVDAHGGLLDALSRVRTLLGLPERAPLALVSPADERRRLPVRLQWGFPESLVPEALLAPLRLAEYFGGERALALLPFDIRFE